MANTRSEGLAPLLVYHSEQEENNTVDPAFVAIDNFQMINQLTGVIQRMQRVLQKQNS